jgi:RimJ/RimL family protein N-acetyltransferase
VIETARLLLRPPSAVDRPWLRVLLDDPEAMAMIGPRRSAAECDEVLDRHLGWLERYGYGFMAVLRREDGAGVGFCGLKPGAENTPIEGEVEIGWMIFPAFWRCGYGYEAAAALLDWGWASTDAARIVAITSACNAPSRALMTRLGMAQLPDGDFQSPRFEVGDPLRSSVTYTIARPT